MILEKNTPKDLLKEAYWFKASNCNFYAVILEFDFSIEKKVNAFAYQIDTNNIDEGIDFNKIKNGNKIMGFDIFKDWVLEINIYSKYYFPKFNESNNQWYHKCDEFDSDCLNDFSFILRESYNIAINVSGLKIY